MPRLVKPPHRIEASVMDANGNALRIQARELVRVNYVESHQLNEPSATLIEYIFEDLSGRHVSYPRLNWIRPWSPPPQPKKQ